MTKLLKKEGVYALVCGTEEDGAHTVPPPHPWLKGRGEGPRIYAHIRMHTICQMRVNTHKYMSDTPIYAHIYVRYTNIRAHTHTRSGSDDGAIMSKKHSRFPSSPFTAATAVFALLPPRACPRRRHSEEEAERLVYIRDTRI